MTRLQRLMQLHRLQSKETGGEGRAGGGEAQNSENTEGTGAPNGEGEGSGEDGAAGDGEGEGEGGKKSSSLTDSEAKLLKELMQHKKESRRAAEELAELKKKYEGIDPEVARKVLTEQQQRELQELEARGEWDKLKAQMAESHRAEKAQLEQSLSQKDAELNALRSQIAELTVGSAFSQSNFIREELTLTPAKTRVVYGSHFEFKDGKIVGYDKPVTDPNRAALVDASGEPLAFEEALKKIVDADPDVMQLKRSKIKTGAGSNTDPGAGSPKKVTGQPRGTAAIAAGLKGLA